MLYLFDIFIFFEFSYGLRVGLLGGDEYLEGFFLGVFKILRFCDFNSVGK